MADEFMEQMQKLFDAGQFAEILTAWGADASNSVAFKEAAFAGYQPRKQDVVISTYPKSGTTWMLQMAYQIAFLGDGDFGHQYDVVPWPDKLIPLDNNIALDDMSVAQTSPTGLHIIKSHLEAEFIPYTPEAKYISVIRDPKDMLVSMAVFENGFNKMLFGDIVPMDSWVESFQSGRFMYQSWPEFIDSWWAMHERDNVLIVTFEEMKADNDGMIKRVAEFMGVSLTTEQIDKVVAKTSFTYMKENDHKFAQPAWDEGYVPLVRSGKSGNSKEALTEAQQQEIDAYCLRELERIGSDFPYREKFDVTVGGGN